MKTNAIPEGYHSVTPYLTVHDAARAIAFYEEAFDAAERFRLNAPDGKVAHAELAIGDSTVMLADEMPGWGNQSPQALGGSAVAMAIYVDDVDAQFDRALAAGATEQSPVQDHFYGDRSGTLVDPFGHVWTVATHKEDVPPEEMQQRFEAAMAEGTM